MTEQEPFESHRGRRTGVPRDDFPLEWEAHVRCSQEE